MKGAFIGIVVLLLVNSCTSDVEGGKMVMQVFDSGSDTIIFSIDGPFYRDVIVDEFDVPIDHSAKELYTLTIQNTRSAPL